MQEVIIDVQERRKIKTMLDVLTVVGGTLEDLNKVMSVGFRVSLRDRNLDEGFMGARMVEQVFRNGTPVRLGPEDIVRSTDYAGPSFRLYWSSAMARDRATQQRLDLSCWLGANAATSLLQACAHTIIRTVTDGIKEGVNPAKVRALARAERILKESVTLLQDAKAFLQNAVEQDETYTPAATALKALYNRSNNLHDVTSDFVQNVIWEICNDLRQQESTARLQAILQQHQETLLKCHKEVNRRREALGQLTLLVMPKLDKADLGRVDSQYVRTGGGDIQKLILTKWLRACLKNSAGNFLCLEPIMKKTSLNEQMVWDGEKGVVIVLQTPTQIQGPVFESGD
jgi:hypothetical protein